MNLKPCLRREIRSNKFFTPDSKSLLLHCIEMFHKDYDNYKKLIVLNNVFRKYLTFRLSPAYSKSEDKKQGLLFPKLGIKIGIYEYRDKIIIYITPLFFRMMKSNIDDVSMAINETFIHENMHRRQSSEKRNTFCDSIEKTKVYLSNKSEIEAFAIDTAYIFYNKKIPIEWLELPVSCLNKYSTSWDTYSYMYYNTETNRKVFDNYKKQVLKFMKELHGKNI